MMMQCYVLRVSSILAGFICTFHVLGGCSETAGTTNPPETGQRAAITFDFFDGAKPISPVQWADLSPPQLQEDASILFESLHIQAVNAKRNRSGNFEEGVRAHPEWDPTMHFIDDLESLKTLGKASRLSLNWKETERDGNVVYRDDFELTSGRRIRGVDLAAYFLTMAALAREGGLQDQETEQRLSESLLMIGYLIYSSDSTVGSEGPRILIVSSAWTAAFTLREQRAIGHGEHDEAELWSKRRLELERATREMQRRRLQQLGGS